PGQGNNMYIFPALGFGSVLAKATAVTDNMVYQSAVSLSEQLNEEEKALGLLYPRLERIRETSANLARDVVLTALQEGLVHEKFVLDLYHVEAGVKVSAEVAKDAAKSEVLLRWVQSKMWTPTYSKL
ncbi:hypothetical protein HDU79_002373, partial [Rhizoclosmatium sp. JEL0117]